MNQNNDWIDFLRKEEESFLPEPPKDLWSGISKRLPASQKAKYKIVPIWIRYSSAAACIVLLLSLGWHFSISRHHISTTEHTDQPQVSARLTDNQHFEHSSISRHEVISNHTKSATRITNHINREENHADVKLLAQETLISENAQDSHFVSKPDNSKDLNKSTEHSPNKDKQSPNHGHTFIAYEPLNKGHRHDISLSIYAGNLATHSSSSQLGYNVLSSVPSGEISDETYEDLEVLTQGSEVKTKKRYDLPLRAGIRISLPLSNRLSIESGLTYTRLSSSAESGSNDDYYSTDQTLHYVGIPLKLRCQIWENKRLSIYASGGGMVEKCVHGNSHTDFVIGGVKYSETEQSISEKPLQFSASLSAGIEAQLTSNIKLFAEPGLNCYIDNQSKVDNSYKDKPINLDLSVGVRFDINK